MRRRVGERKPRSGRRDASIGAAQELLRTRRDVVKNRDVIRSVQDELRRVAFYPLHASSISDNLAQISSQKREKGRRTKREGKKRGLL